jgi:hypothetical protein
MRTSEDLRDRLRDLRMPGEAEAAARSWPVVEAALAERAPSVRHRRTRLRLALVVALICAGLATALSPAGAWIGDRLGDGRPAARPAFAALPPGGSVLAISKSGAYAVRPDGSSRQLGAFTEAGWSPRGLHVVGVEGRQLVAVDPAATVKWTLTARRPVHHPAWSKGDGFAVAYLEGHSLSVVAGNGDPTTNRVLRRDAASVTPAWEPHSDRTLTYATTAGAIETIDVDTGRTLWTSAGRSSAPVSPAPRSSAPKTLAWSGGETVVALSSREVTVLDRTGRIRRTIPLPGVARELAVHPSGRRAAVVIGNRVVEVGLRRTFRRQLFQGSVDGIAWSQNGRRLMVGWRNADEWLLLGPGQRVRALHGVSRGLGAAGGFPRVAGWCCSN